VVAKNKKLSQEIGVNKKSKGDWIRSTRGIGKMIDVTTNGTR